MADLEDIDTVLSRVSGDGYIERINGKIDDLMEKLREGDAALTAEGYAPGDGGSPWGSTDHLGETISDLVSIDPGSFEGPITAYSAAALLLGADLMHDKAIEAVSPDTYPSETVTQYMEKAHKTLAGDGTPADPGWTGDSATSFEEDFAKYFLGPGQTVVNQRWMINSLQTIMEAHRAVYARTRNDVEDLLDKALEAAGMADDLTPGGTAKFMVTVVAAVVAISAAGATAPAGAATWPVLAATTSAAASVLGAVPADDPQPYDLQACCCYDLFFSVQGAANKLKGDRDDREAEVTEALNEFTSQVTSGSTREKLVGPVVADSGGDSPINWDGDNADLDDGYADQFEPPG